MEELEFIGKLRDHLNHRLEVLQKKRNFDPNLGVEQVTAVQEARLDFGMFAEILAIGRKFSLNLTIPQGGYRRVDSERKVYFQQERGTTRWKVGNSINPKRRRDTFQTGNASHLKLRYTVTGGYAMETAVKRYLKKYAVGGGGGTEWYDLDPNLVRELVSSLKSEGSGVLESTT